jgi:hypothetical protein
MAPEEDAVIGRIAWTLLVATTFAGLAAAFGYQLQRLLNPNRPVHELLPLFVIAPAAGAFVATGATWWWGMMLRTGGGVLRGAAMGALSVVASYLLFAVAVSLLMTGVVTLPWLLLLAPVATGWLTLPLGAVVGALLGLVQRRVWRPMPEPSPLLPPAAA